MNRDDLLLLKQWFSGYCASFYTSDEEDNRNLALKEEHTARVCANILKIAGEESLGAGDAMIAEATALFHDVGRFPQYAKYKTFKDSLSVNHGELGAKELAGAGILNNLPVREQEIITTAVKFHNAFKIPDLVRPDAIIFLKMLRDADKLDIWRIFFEYYGEDSTKDMPSAVGLGFPDTPEYSREVLDCIFNKQLVSLAMLKTLNDFKLTKLSWVYDLNFRSSLRMAVEDNYIDGVTAALPRTGEIRKTVEIVREYIRRRLEGDQSG
ncbi:MAG TPA: HD domain-containing protein [Dissulfurispiraceae bacterium]|nr:HD domain-containing protein [Dissulfurispiraceae bacterium]